MLVNLWWMLLLHYKDNCYNTGSWVNAQSIARLSCNPFGFGQRKIINILWLNLEIMASAIYNIYIHIVLRCYKTVRSFLGFSFWQSCAWCCHCASAWHKSAIFFNVSALNVSQSWEVERWLISTEKLAVFQTHLLFQLNLIPFCVKSIYYLLQLTHHIRAVWSGHYTQICKCVLLLPQTLRLFRLW